MQKADHIMKIWLFIFCIMLLLAGCSQANSQNPLVQYSPTPGFQKMPTEFESTISPSPITAHTTQPEMTSTATATSTIVPTPTRAQKPYLIKYEESAGDGAEEIIACLAITSPVPKFILYEDGQIIKAHNGQLFESKLSKAEIDNLLSRIKKIGYFEVDTSFNGAPGMDGVYNLPKGYEYGEGGWNPRIEVLDKGVTVLPSIYKFVVQPIRETIDIVEKYVPKEEIKPYTPDKVQLYVLDVNNKTDQEFLSQFFHSLPPVAGEWPTELPALRINPGDLYLNETEIITLISSHLITGIPDKGIFTQKGEKYFVEVCPDLDAWW